MPRRIQFCTLCFLSLVVFASQLTACSTFLFGSPNGPLFVARNYDWDSGEGLAVINQRGIKKTAMTLDRPARWTSQYGSLTFCQYGREFPCDGMNEAGLMVTVLWLDGTKYPQPDQRPSVSTLQWVQYQLDTAGSVADVIASDEKVRIVSLTRSSVHYFVADKSGDCATIEFIDGKMVSHRGADLEFPALTNSTYQQSVQSAKQCRRLGGSKNVGQSDSSIDRFCRAALAATAMCPDDESEPGPASVEAGFKKLHNLGPTDFTKWRIVYDLKQGIVHFRTNEFPQTKKAQLDDFDLSTIGPVMVVDMNSEGSGNIREQFSAYTAEQNRQIFMTALDETGVLDDVPLGKQLIELVVHYPEQCHPAETEQAVPAASE